MSCLSAAQALGAEINKGDDIWTVSGTGGQLVNKVERIDIGNSGTSLRIFTALAATADFQATFDGDHSIRTRPMKTLLDALCNLGVQCQSTEGKCPLSVKGPIKGGETDVDGKSSQFLSALLFSTPLARQDSIIRVNDLHEKPYVEITLDWLRKQNIELEHNQELSEFRVRGSQAYHPFDLTIPADFSTATFPLLAAAITGGTVSIRNLDFQDRQGDKAVFDFFRQMGVIVEKMPSLTRVTNPSGDLNGIEIDLNNTPDALPAMAVAAAVANGRTTLKNVAQARIKETDRIECMSNELRKMGAQVEELADGMIIEGSGRLNGAELMGYEDHRIVMALAVAGLVAEGETVINGSEAASVTYPGFVNDFRNIGADITEID